MNEFDNDELIHEAFADFETAVGPDLHLPEAGAVRTTAVRRHKLRIVTLSILVALTGAIPATAYGALNHTAGDPADNVSTRTGATAEPGEPSLDPSVPASAHPSVSESTPTVPDGRITIAQLRAVTVRIPAWTTPVCPSGNLRLPTGGLDVTQVAHANLDGDSAVETAAVLTCKSTELGEAPERQVVAFDRDAAGDIITLGQLVQGKVWSVKANSRSGVEVDISDHQACCDEPKAMELHQIRTYGWNGTALVQLSGPVAFSSHAQPTDLALRVDGATWGPEENGFRPGTIQVTVKNNGPYKSNEFIVYDGSSASAATNVERHRSLAVGESMSFTVTVLRDGPPHDVLQLYEMGSVGIGGDANPADNHATFPLWDGA